MLSYVDFLSALDHTPDVPQPAGASVTVEALNVSGEIRITWTVPTLRSGQVITGYSIQYQSMGSPTFSNISLFGINATSYTINKLNLGTVYEVRVASVGPLGLSGYCCGSGKQVVTYNCE